MSTGSCCVTGRVVARPPYISPPTIDPSDQTASSTPPAAGALPCASANAGNAVSTAPKPTPTQVIVSSRASTAGDDSGPMSAWTRSGCGRTAATARLRLRPTPPTSVMTPLTTTAAPGPAVAATPAVSPGPMTKQSSTATDSREYAVATAGPSTISAQSARITEPSGGTVSPAATATTPRTTVGRPVSARTARSTSVTGC